MDSYGLYEDLSLFNGDLLVGFPLLADEEPLTTGLQAQDGLSSIIKDSMVEAPIVLPKLSAKVVLGHPQQGSADLGLADLLALSPTNDLTNSLESAWMDTKVDLLDLLTSDTDMAPTIRQSPSIEPVRPAQLQLILPSSPGRAAVVPSTSAPTTPNHTGDYSLEMSLDVLQNLLSADVKVDLLNTPTLQDNVPSMDLPKQDFTYMEQSDNMDTGDIFMELNATCLEDLLSTELDASIEDGPILSPVSAVDIESLLSSSPPSPGNGLTSFMDTLDTSNTQADSAYSSLNVSLVSNAGTEDCSVVFESFTVEEAVSPGPEHTAKNPSRSAPYSKSGGRRVKNADRKERKKEQNRSAALKYRQRKKEENGTARGECEILEERNNELKDKVDSISREIQYLKDLLADVYKAKGLVPKKAIIKIIKKK